MTEAPDVIDDIVGIAPGSRLDQLRAERPQARKNAQASHDALFASADTGGMSQAERFAVASFVAGLHEHRRLHAFYAARLLRNGNAALVRAVDGAISAGRTRGPYGAYPPGPLSAEDEPGIAFVMPSASRDVIEARLAAALEHAHRLVFHPRDASPEALRALLEAGWTTTGVVTLSQLVAFLSFQIRVVAGLSVLADEGEETR